LNDIKDIRQNPDKYRKGLGDRGMDPSEIGRLLDADQDARLARTQLQNLQSQANVYTDICALDKTDRMPPEAKELRRGELTQKLMALREERLKLLAEEIERLDAKIAAADAEVAECDRREAVLVEVCDEIRAEKSLTNE